MDWGVTLTSVEAATRRGTVRRGTVILLEREVPNV